MTTTSHDETAAPAHDLTARFRKEARALCETLSELDSIQREAWQRQSKVARRAIAALQRELSAAEAEARAERARTRDEFDAAITEMVDAWRARLDDLRVQLQLAEMNARDVLTAAEEQLSGFADEVRGDADASLDQLREAARAARQRIEGVLAGSSAASDA